MWRPATSGSPPVLSISLSDQSFSVQLQSDSRARLHRRFPRKRHQMRYLCHLLCLLAKQVLSMRACANQAFMATGLNVHPSKNAVSIVVNHGENYALCNGTIV